MSVGDILGMILVILWFIVFVTVIVWDDIKDWYKKRKPRRPHKPTIKLPCNVGDVVWFDTYSDKGINGGLKPHEVLDFKVYAVVSSDRGYPCDINTSEFGKTVFLTKKGANTNEK